MATNNILLVKEFDAKKINYSNVKETKNGGRSCFINYEGAPLILQLPWMTIPFAMNETGYEGAPLTKYVLSLSFRGLQTDARLQLLLDKLTALQDQIIGDGVDNSLTWFKKKGGSLEFVDGKFCHFVKYSKDKKTGEINDKYDPTISIKLPYDFAESKFQFASYDVDGGEIDFGTVKPNIRGGRARLIVQVTGLWFTSVGFGFSTKCIQGQFDIRPSGIPKGIQFRKEDDDADDKPAPLSHENDEELDDIAADGVDADVPSPAAAKAKTEPVVAAAVETVEEAEAEDEEEAVEEEEDDEEAERKAAEAALAAAKLAADAKKKKTVKKTAAA